MNHTQQLEQLIKLQNLISNFAQIRRTVFHKNGAAENDVEHSYTLALAAWLLSRNHDDLDTDKCIKYALVHDLPEILAGDTDIYDQSDFQQSKQSREMNAIIKLEIDYPELTDLIDVIKKYEMRVDRESKFVYCLDKLTPIILNLTANGLGWQRHEPRITLDQLRSAKDKKIALDPNVEKIYLELIKILEKRPELFENGEKK